MIAGWNSTKEEPELYYVDDKATRCVAGRFSTLIYACVVVLSMHILNTCILIIRFLSLQP